MLTWADVIKLIVAYLCSVSIVGIRAWWSGRRSRMQEEQAIWRGICQGSGNLLDAVRKLQSHHAAILESGRPRFVRIDIPDTLLNLAEQLAKSDSNNAYVYSDYRSFAHLFSKNQDFLDTLRQRVLFEPDRCDQVIPTTARCIRALADDLICVKTKELEILRALNKKRGFDAQEINKLANQIESARQVVFTAVPAPPSRPAAIVDKKSRTATPTQRKSQDQQQTDSGF